MKISVLLPLFIVLGGCKKIEPVESNAFPNFDDPATVDKLLAEALHIDDAAQLTRVAVEIS